mgnify:CR=1 FL=1
MSLSPRPLGKLSGDMLAIGAGHSVFAFGQWMIGVAIAKLAGVEAMAAFGFALMISAPIYFLTGMGLRTALARDAAGALPFSDYWQARIAGAVAAALLMALAGFTVAAGRGFDGTAALLAFALVKSADAGFDLIYGLRQRDGQARAVWHSLLRRGLLGPAACAAALAATGGELWAGLSAWAGAACILLLWQDAPAARAARRREPARTGALGVFKSCWPLGVGAAVASLETAIPRYVIEWRMEPDALGYFTGLFLFFQAIILVGNAFGSAATPHLGRAHAAGDFKRFNRLLLGLLALAVLIGGGGVAVAALIGPWLLGIVYTPAYSAYADIFTLIMAAAALRLVASFLQFAIIAAGRFKAHMGVHLTIATIALAIAPALVGAHGLAGAAYVLIVATVVQLLLLAALAWRGGKASRDVPPSPDPS